MKKVFWLVLTIIGLCFSKSEAQNFGAFFIPSADSLRNGIGKKTEMLFSIYDTNYDRQSNITYLNVGDNSPNQILTLIINSVDRKNFIHPPEKYYRHKELKVVGIPELVNGKLQVQIHNPSQLMEPVSVMINK